MFNLFSEGKLGDLVLEDLGIIAAAGAAKVLAKASLTMAKADLWKARLAVKTLLPGPARGDRRGGGKLRRRASLPPPSALS